MESNWIIHIDFFSSFFHYSMVYTTYKNTGSYATIDTSQITTKRWADKKEWEKERHAWIEVRFGVLNHPKPEFCLLKGLFIE